ncbi:hypothetical protein K439DRAFT_1625121 [Ramaria rubella]|nr:hypothetical protein K439DRAFT_1625121 [Ramaria rubella]
MPPPNARPICEADLLGKKVEELVAFVNQPWNLPLWPIKTGKDKYPACKVPTHAALIKYLLDLNVGMKTDLPEPSEALKAAATERAKKQARGPGKSQGQTTRTLAAQKDALVAQAQADGTIKPVKLAQTLSALNIRKLVDPQVGWCPYLARRFTGHLHSRFQPETQAQGQVEESNTNSLQIEGCQCNGDTPNESRTHLAPELEVEGTTKVLAFASSVWMADDTPFEQGDSLDVTGSNVDFNPGAALAHSVSANAADGEKTLSDQMVEAHYGEHLENNNSVKDVVFQPQDEYPAVSGLDPQALHWSAFRSLRVLIHDLRAPDREEARDVVDLVTGSAIRGKRAFKLKVPSPDEPGYWTVIAATEDGEQLEDVVPSVSSVIIQGGKLELWIVPSSVVGETPGGSNKRERGFSTTSMDVAQAKKPRKDSPTPPESGAETDGDDVRAVDHKVRGGTHEPRFSRRRKAERTEEVEDYLRGKLEEWPGWQEFRNAKGKVLTNPEVEFDTCRSDGKGTQ